MVNGTSSGSGEVGQGSMTVTWSIVMAVAPVVVVV